MATVFEARDGRLDRTVAVKRMKPEASARPDHRDRFFREARIIGGLAHPGVISIHDAGSLEEGEPFYAMEKVQGETLLEMLRDRGPEDLQRHGILKFVDIFERVCQTIAFAHAQDVIHRDLKPGNIMVDRFGAVFVMDWGLAKRVATEEAPAADNRTQDGLFMGTPAYVSPEQARGLAGATDFNTDVFALGVILYEILTGEAPFRGASNKEIIEEVLFHEPAPPARLNRRVARELSAICMKALAKDPRRRYLSAADLADDIRRYREFRPVSAIKPRLVDHAANWVRRHKVVATMLGTVMLAGVLVGGYFTQQAWLTRRVADQVLATVESTEQQIALLEQQADGLLLELQQRGLDAEERRRFERSLADVEARITVMQIDNRSRLAAVIGLSIDAPDPRAVSRYRSQTRQVIENLIENENYPLARAFIRSALEMVERGNMIGLSADEVRELNEQLGAVEARMERAP
jgi:serine/threonine-protein kinase